jgi:beta-galactosidase
MGIAPGIYQQELCMKVIVLFPMIIITGMLPVIPALQPVFAANNRVVINMNQTWKFTKGDNASYQAVGFDDNSWSSVGLPHSASIPFFINDSAYVGWVWYRKHFSVDAAYSARRIFIDFEAAFQHAWVYINGQLVGEHKGGYTGFTYDITAQITFGQDNVCAVRLSNLWEAAIAPRAGDAWFHAGLYRDVSLVITDPLHVARLGTFVTTPQVSASRARVNVKTEVVNQGMASKTCMVVSTVFDPANTAVINFSTSAAISAGQTYVFSQDTAISNPTLWSPANPKLYRLLTQVYDNGTEVDTYSTIFGVRWYAATAANGFSLNGQRLYLQGFNVHQDRAGWADAAVNYDFYRDLKMLKDAGTNCVRCSHYPHDMAFYEACDKLGILAFAELHFWGRGGFAGGGELSTWYAEAYPTTSGPRAEFDSTLTANFRDMVYEARNHPSIFAWSLGNETDMQMPASVVTNAKALWTSLYTLSHKLDSSRLVSSGWVDFANNATNPRIVDLLGMNGGNPGTQQSAPVLTTEYGSCVADRPGSYSGCGEPSAASWRCGALRWLAFHHGTHCQGNGGNWAHMGVCDYHRLPLRQYYWTRNAWLGIPQPAYPAPGTAAKLVITADKTTILNDGTDDCHLTISVQNSSNQLISNTVNGTLQVVSGPGQLPTGTTWSFSTPDGRQAIEMRSYGTGPIVVSASSGSLTPGSFTITAQDPVQSVGVRAESTRNLLTLDGRITVHNDISRRIGVSLAIVKPSRCTLTLYTMLGQMLRSRETGILQSGDHDIFLNGSSLPDGIYILKVGIGNAEEAFRIGVVGMKL